MLPSGALQGPNPYAHMLVMTDYFQEVVVGTTMESDVDGEDTRGDRCESQMSTISERQDICRICHCEGEEGNKLTSPCLCLGSLKYVHMRCLQKWIKSSEKLSCELCHFDYLMTTKTKPFRQVSQYLCVLICLGLRSSYTLLCSLKDWNRVYGKRTDKKMG